MTSELTSRTAYAVAKARHRWVWRRSSNGPVVVFSMAKTGSSAVVAGLRNAGIDRPFHVHNLDPAFLAAEEAEYRWSGRPWRVWDAQQLHDRPPTPAAPWRVISMVRDPIAQTASAFFQPGLRRGYLEPGATVDDLNARFAGRLDHLPLTWFESHLEPALGIDVFASDFDPVQGYSIIETPGVRLLLLRSEDQAVAPKAIAELLGTEHPVEIPRVNVGSEKTYADAYASFLRALEPTAAQLDRAYSSRLVRHFYAPDEIAGFRARWTGTHDQTAR